MNIFFALSFTFATKWIYFTRVKGEPEKERKKERRMNAQWMCKYATFISLMFPSSLNYSALSVCLSFSLLLVSLNHHECVSRKKKNLYFTKNSCRSLDVTLSSLSYSCAIDEADTVSTLTNFVSRVEWSSFFLLYKSSVISFSSITPRVTYTLLAHSLALSSRVWWGHFLLTRSVCHVYNLSYRYSFKLVSFSFSRTCVFLSLHISDGSSTLSRSDTHTQAAN